MSPIEPIQGDGIETPGHGTWPGGHRPVTMSWSVALASLGCLLAVGLYAGPQDDPGDDTAASLHGAGTALGCAVEPALDGGVQLSLVNTTAAPMPAGTRWAWSSLATPWPVGEVRVLTQPLAPAQGLVVHSRLPPRGLGCTTSVLLDKDLPR